MTEKAKNESTSLEVTTKGAIAAAFICSSKCLFYPYFHLYMLYTGSNITTVNNSNTYYITRILCVDTTKMRAAEIIFRLPRPAFLY